MAGKPPGTRRSTNVAVRFPLATYIRKLADQFGASVEGGIAPGELRVSDRGTGSCPRAVEYLFGELLSKFDDKDSAKAQVRYQSCLDRFYEAEELCRDTNWRFRNRSFLYHRVLTDECSVGSVFNTAARKIAFVLGDLDGADLAEGCDFGPGATTRTPRSKSHTAYKLEGIPHATIHSTPAIMDILHEYPGWEAHLRAAGAPYEIVSGNKVVSVPKNYKTDRMIAIEPDWLIFLQKGIGSWIRRRLRMVKQDLDTQETNGFLAGLGSIDGSLATIDLSMASDCVSYELVRYLLPPDWFDRLEQVRSPRGVLPSGDVVNYQKFSSMGNGYTFELESLIFWALCSSVVDLMRLEDRRVYVYGDDIVIPTDAFTRVCEILTLAGFRTNPKKSFSSGPFRESCGQHWLDGDLITPIYIRESIDTLDRLFLLHNNTCRILERLGSFVTSDPLDVSHFLEWIRSFAPAGWQKPRLPRLDVGDGAFYGCFSLSTPRVSRHKDRRSWFGWEIEVLSPRITPLLAKQKRGGANTPSLYKLPEEGYLLSRLWRLERSGSTVTVPLSMRAVMTGLLPEPYDDGLIPVEWMRVASRPDVPRWAISWRRANMMVRSLESDYCWWEFATH